MFARRVICRDLLCNAWTADVKQDEEVGLPNLSQSIALISLANILHQAGHLDDAIIVMAAALDVSKEVVIAQFTLANIYAAKVSNIFVFDVKHIFL